MGTILKGVCENCGYKATVFVGGGMNDYKPEITLAVTKNHPGLAAALQKNAYFSIDRKLATCVRCQEFTAETQVTYQEPNKPEKTISMPCNVCGARLSYLPRKGNHLACPKCGRIVDFFPAGHWD